MSFVGPSKVIAFNFDRRRDGVSSARLLDSVMARLVFMRGEQLNWGIKAVADTRKRITSDRIEKSFIACITVLVY